MFEDVFEPFDEIDKKLEDEKDEWAVDVWDTGEKEDLWRSNNPDPQNVWSVDPKQSQPPLRPQSQPSPQVEPDEVPDDEPDKVREEEPAPAPSRGSGLFDDLFLDIF